MKGRIGAEAESILKERFGKDAVIALATDAGGIPSVRYVNAFYENGCFYVITHAGSNKMRQLRENPNAAIAGEWFTAHGIGKDLGRFGSAENQELAQKLREVFAAWIDNGHTDLNDENTVILCLELTDGLLLSHGTRYKF